MESHLFEISVADFKFYTTPYSNSNIPDNHSASDLSVSSQVINVEISEIDISNEKLACESKNRGSLFSTAIHRKIAETIPNYNSFVVHSVTVDISGEGVVLAAQSGTGKSSHLANWYAYINGEKDMPESLKKLRIKNSDLRIKAKDGEETPKLTIVNGDKPIVRFFDEDFCKEHNLEIPEGTIKGVPYAYGTPWCGKERLGCNMRTPLKHICFIERSDTNFVTKPTKSEAVSRIMKQVYMPKDPVALSKTLELTNRLINSCELWVIHCNMEPESAEVAYKAIFEE